ncbi:hypothetical protein [Gluconacetobacter sp.]|uniref:hypothetical protein n=1 Tax=Gluconacetobacter sp. TaxID=1935994 RepID=UPI0039E8E2E6
MRRSAIAAAAIALAVPLQVQAQTPIPECASRLAEPAPGQVLTPAELDANNACVTVMQQAKIVSDLGTAMQENIRRLTEKDKPRAAAGVPDRPALELQPPPLSTRQDDAVPAPPTPPPAPTYDTIWTDGGRTGATLRFSDGSSQDVERGTRLRDESVVTAISSRGLTLRRPDGSVLTLRGSSDAPTPTRIIAVPGAPSYPPPTHG